MVYCASALMAVLVPAMTHICLAMEEGRASATGQAVCTFRVLGAYDLDTKVRNRGHMAEKMLGFMRKIMANLSV